MKFLQLFYLGSGVFRPKYSDIFANRTITTFGLRIKELIVEANINIDTIRDVTVPEFPPWELESPIILYCLKTVKFNDVQDTYFDHQFLFSDDSKDDHKVGCAVVSNFIIMKICLPGQASIYTTELRAIQLALDVVNIYYKDKYVMCVESVSCIQAIEHQHMDHPLVLDVLKKYSALRNKTRASQEDSHMAMRCPHYTFTIYIYIYIYIYILNCIYVQILKLYLCIYVHMKVMLNVVEK